MSDKDDADWALSVTNGVKRHACRFILSKWQSFTDLNGTIRAISNLQWSKSR